MPDNKQIFRLATAGIACVASSIVSAQDKQAEAPAGAASSASPQAKADDPKTLDTIVITANRRRQTIETVPLAVTAVQGSELAERGVYNPQDLASTLPNVQNGSAGFSIRGIASSDFTPKGDPSTAFSLDGIFIARPQVQSLSMFDLERVEVLRGPQGTLYGRNATSGAVNVISARPVFAQRSSVGLDVGNYNTIRATAMVNTQLSESSALRIAAATNHHGGYTETRDGTKDLDSRGDASVRLRYLNDLTDNTSALVTVDYSRQSDTGPARLPASRVISGGVFTEDKSNYFQNPGDEGFFHLKSGGLTVEINSEFPVGTLTSLTGYRKTTLDEIQLLGDQGGVRGFNNYDFSQISQELRLTSKGNAPLQWVTGLFLFREKGNASPTVVIPGFGNLAWDLDNESNSAAVFAQGTYTFLPNWRGVAGLRYTHDSKKRDGTASGSTIFGTFADPYAASVSYSKTSYKLGLEYDLPNKALLYADVSTGYKAGGFNDGNPQVTQNLYYNPENMLAVQAGIKGRFLADKSLYLSVSAFKYKYEDLQLGSLPPTGGLTTLNAGSAKVHGLEIEGNWRVTSVDKLDFNLSRLEARFDQYSPGNPPQSYAGKYLDQAPRGSVRVGYSHDFQTSVGRVNVGLATKYSSSYFVSDYSAPTQFVQRAFWRSDAHVAYYGAGDRWYVQLYGRNLENKRQMSSTLFGTFTITDPRQYGIRGVFNF